MVLQTLSNRWCFLAFSLILTACGGTPPTIATQPSNQSVVAGQTATFSVTAMGSGRLNYQWVKGTTAIAGATFASYTIPPASTFDNGSRYSVVVSNSGGGVTSNAATLSVNAPANKRNLARAAQEIRCYWYLCSTFALLRSCKELPSPVARSLQDRCQYVSHKLRQNSF